MLYIERKSKQTDEWYRKPEVVRSYGEAIIDDFRISSKNADAHTLLHFKGIIRQLAEGSPFAQPETVVQIDVSPKEQAFYERYARLLIAKHNQLNDPDSLEQSEPKLDYHLISEITPSTVAQAYEVLAKDPHADYYLKPNMSALGTDIFHIQRHDQTFSATALNNYLNNQHKKPVFIYLDDLSQRGIIRTIDEENTVTYVIPVARPYIVRNLIGLQLYKSLHIKKNQFELTKRSSILESTFQNLFTVHGRTYETRHTIKAQIRDGFVADTVNHMAKFGGSKHFGTLSLLKRQDLSDDVSGTNCFQPLLQHSHIPEQQFIQSLEQQVHEYVRYMQQRIHDYYPSVIPFLTGQSSFTVDLCWSIQQGYPVPYLIENHIEAVF